MIDQALFNRTPELRAALRGAPAGLAGPNVAATAGVPVSLATPMMAHLDSAGSPYTIWAGTLIPGLLVTGVNSDLPGEVVGQTSRDVYDSRTQQILLLPKGARLIGAYDNRLVSTGRLVVGWTRIILPDGRSMTLPRLPATDERGQAGLHDQVDSHYGQLYGTALMTSALTAGIQLSQPQQSGLYAAPSAGQVAAGSLGQNLGNVSLESARRGLDVSPTVIIRPGQPFNVFLGGDVVFDGPYLPTTFAATP
jgi:type IV secretion system protein VirB10